MKIEEINSTKKFSFPCVYLWTNQINNKHYVGSTINFYQRMKQYRQGFFNKYFKKDVEKYGIENFDVIVLEKEVEKSMLWEREQYWIDYYKSYERENGYNICQFAGNTLGYKHSDEAKEIIKEKWQKWYEENPNYFNGESNPMFGKKCSEKSRNTTSKRLKELWKDEEYRNFWQERMSGENNPMYGVRLCGELNPRWGKHCSEETKEKIRKANLGHKPSKCTKVVCVETGEIFESMCEAAKRFNTYASAIKIAVDNPNRTCKKNHFKIVE